MDKIPDYSEYNILKNKKDENIKIVNKTRTITSKLKQKKL